MSVKSYFDNHAHHQDYHKNENFYLPIVDFIKKNKVKAIFVETSVSPATIHKISGDSGAIIGGELFSDSLGSEGDRTTYIGMFEHNVKTIVNALL